MKLTLREWQPALRRVGILITLDHLWRRYRQWRYRVPAGFMAVTLVAVLLFSVFAPPKAKAVTVPFTSSGTWTVPSGVSSITIEAWGGGGAGGGASTNNAGGGGGAGGQYAIKNSQTVSYQDVYTITVAASRAGTTGSGTAGNDSFVSDPSSTVVVMAKGGAGGPSNASGSGFGSTSGGIGDVVYAGGSGVTGALCTGCYGGGGGGGAGSTGAGGDGSSTTGGTGTGANGGDGGAATTVKSAGNPGNNYGGGGGGAYKTTGPSQSGGAGAQGYVVISYTTVPAQLGQAAYRIFQNSNQGTYRTITDNPTAGTDAAYSTASDGTYLYTVGYDSTGTNEWRIEKRNLSDGALVSGFGTGGVVTENVSAGDDRANTVIVTGGNIYVAGYDTAPGSSAEVRIEKRDATGGGLVSGFGTGGVITEDALTTTNDQIRSLATDGTYLYAVGDVGASGTDFQWRIEKRALSDGSLSYGINDNASANNDTPYSVVYDSGYIYVGGLDMPVTNGDGEYRLEKRDVSTGGLVSGFGSGGVVLENYTTVVDTSGIPESITSMVTDSSNIYTLSSDEQATGDTEYHWEKRDKATGGLVSGFGSGGVVTENPSSTYDTPQVLAGDGTYIYSSGPDRSQDGGFSEWRIEKRAMSDGSLDNNFGSSGVYVSNPSTSHDELRAILLDGTSIHAVGYDFSPGNYQWRYEKISSLDGLYSGPSLNPLAAQNTAATGVGTGTAFRLRMLLAESGSATAQSGYNLKLQYAVRGADNTCDTSFSGETYSDVTTTGAIQFNTNSALTDGTNSWRTANDPTDGTNPVVAQTYDSANPFSNAASSISAGSDGQWDLSLINASAPLGTSYCFRVVKSDGSVLDSYATIPQVDTPAPNSAPAAPTLSTPSSGATGISVSPSFSLRTTDADSDYLQYKIILYQSDCATVVATIDQTSSQTGWSGQDQQTGSAYTGAATIASSTLATYTYTGALSNNTTYCWKAAAMDPGGSNTFSGYSATQSFTTQSAGPSNTTVLRGGISTGGGIHFGN